MEEFTDNLHYILKAWKAKTETPCLLSYDNAKIQEKADIRVLYHPDHPGVVEKAIKVNPETQKLKLPPYSHDLNRPIEHIFGTMKHKIREGVYKKPEKYTKADDLQNLVWKLFHEEIPQGHVAKDVSGLHYLWDVLSTPYGVRFLDDDDKEAVGTGGNWPKAYYR